MKHKYNVGDKLLRQDTYINPVFFIIRAVGKLDYEYDIIEMDGRVRTENFSYPIENIDNPDGYETITLQISHNDILKGML